MNSPGMIITPKTKIAELLNAYPELEETLVDLAPAFKKLKNPFLRNTIARITSLQQAASVGEIPVHTLVNALRKKAGQEELDGLDDGAKSPDIQPSWFDKSKIRKSLDARPIIEEGGHPVGEVLQEVRGLEAGDIFELITPFMPTPLIDKVVAQGFENWTSKESEECFFNYFLKK